MNDWPQVTAARVEAFVRWTTYAVVVTPVVSVAVGLALSNDLLARFPIALICALILATLLAVCNVLVARWSVGTIMTASTAGVRRWFLAAWGAVFVSLVAVLFMVPDPVAWLSISVAITSVLTSFAPMLSAREAAWLNLGYVFLAALLLILVPKIALLILITVLGTSGALWGTWSTAWMLRVQLALASANADRAALALADERLRIARDLHDVFGRTLATITVKSELAYELMRRERDESAGAEMIEIRRLASEAGAEVRRVVRGELVTTWEAEIAGAKSLLAAAGISCTISGEPVPPPVADALAWVVREGVTNVLRHSTADQVSITTTASSSDGTREAQLTVANNGAAKARSSVADPNTGSGLVTMSARVRALGGRVTTARDGDWFVLEAVVPFEGEGDGK